MLPVYSYFLTFVEVGNLQMELASPLYSYFLIFVEIANLQISSRHFANIYAFGIHLRHANISDIMLGISNSLFNYCNVTITLYAYILVCFLVPLAPEQCKL